MRTVTASKRLSNLANALGAKVRKGEKSAVVVYYGQSGARPDEQADNNDDTEGRFFRFQKSYRVFNACQSEGLPDNFYPEPEPLPEHPSSEPVPHIQAFFDAIDVPTVFGGDKAC